MTKKRKRRATIQPLRSVRTIREIGVRSFPEETPDPEINDGEEFQARDGSNLRTMAEAEAEERREAQAEQERQLVERRERQEAAEDQEMEERTIPEILWSLTTSPFRLAIALFKIPLATRTELARGPS